MADREAGMAWLGEVRERLEGERYGSVKAGLATWFHLTGGAKVGTGRCGEAGETPRSALVGDGGGLSCGGRVSGVAGSWKEAGERFKGFLACRAYSKNTIECYVEWARRFCR